LCTDAKLLITYRALQRKINPILTGFPQITQEINPHNYRFFNDLYVSLWRYLLTNFPGIIDMANYKALQIIRTFTKEEMKEFEKFLASPYFSTGRDMMPLFTYLKKYHPEYKNQKALELDAVHKALSVKGKKTGADTTRKLLSDLYGQAERFLIQRGLDQKVNLQGTLLLGSLREKYLYSLYDSKAGIVEKYFIPGGNVEPDFYAERSSFEAEKSYYYSQRTDQNKYFESFNKMTDGIVLFILMAVFESIPNEIIMKYSYDLSNKNGLLGEFEKAIDFDLLLKNLKLIEHEHYKTLALHYYLYKAYKDTNDDASYVSCRDLLFENYSIYSQKQLFSLCIYLEALCIRRVDLLKPEFEEEQMKIYRFMYEKKILSFTDKEHIPLPFFKNVIITAGLNMIEWTDDFVATNLPQVEPGNRQSIKNLWEARKCLLLKDYTGVIQHTHRIDFNFYLLKIEIRKLYLMAYYELGYFEEARSMAETYYKYLTQNPEVAEKLKEGNLNFVSIYKKLLKMKESKLTEKLHEVKKEIEASKHIIKRGWLLEKANELA